MGRIGRHFVAICWVVVALLMADLTYGYLSDLPATGSRKIVVDVVALFMLFWLGSIFNGFRIRRTAKAVRLPE